MTELLLKITGYDDIRGMHAPDGLQVFSVYDFMTKACAYKSKDLNASARNEFKRLISDDSEFKHEIEALSYYLQFPGQKRETPCMTVRGLQRLLMILGGKVAAEFRALVEEVFTRVMAGDQSLIEVINANAASNDPVQQLYRQALAQEPVVSPAVDDLSLARKRRMEELEIERLEVEIASKKMTNEAMARNSEREHLIKIADSYRELCLDTVMDERMRLMLKDGFMNMALAAQKGSPCQGLLTDGGGVSPNTPISLSMVANDLGLKIADGDWQSIGLELSNRYFALHGKRPEKHPQTVGGKIMDVCNYYERDRPLMVEVFRWHVEKQESEQTSEQTSGKKLGKKRGKKTGKNSGQSDGQGNIINYMYVYQRDEDD